MKAICVVCGSSTGRNPVFRAAVEGAGEPIARHGLRPVYGGGNVELP